MKRWLRKTGALTAAVLLCLSTWAAAAGFEARAAGLYDAPVFAAAENTGEIYAQAPQYLGATQTVSVPLPDNTTQSSNWAGYIDTPASGDGYTNVSGTWTVPEISDGGQDAAAAQWVGLGGVSTTDLLQIGTIETVENGVIAAEVFYEILPASAQYLIAVPVGSTITANIVEVSASSGRWELTYEITTPDGQTESDSVAVALDSAYAGEIGTSAEWINEDPSDERSRLYPLADTGTVEFTCATVDGEALDSSGNTVEPVALVSGGQIVLAPSELGSDGMSFSTVMTETERGTGQSSSESASGETSGTGAASLGFPGAQSFPQRGRGLPGMNWGWRGR